MIARSYSVAFQGIEARTVEIQCALMPGLPSFTIVGLPDKAVSEARERVRAALNALSISLPSRRITINLSPADLPKVGSHFDLPIAVALLAATGLVPPEEIEGLICIGELALDGSLVPISGSLPAALLAAEQERTLICPAQCGAEAAWVEDAKVIAPATIAEFVAHLTGQRIIEAAEPKRNRSKSQFRDLADVRGQEKAKRAIEIAAAGRHHLLLTGPPGTGKSMLAARIPGILPALDPAEALETSMIYSLAGQLDQDGIIHERPFREPHHTASMASIVGGGKGAKPGEISLAHNGVLFMDEFPEYPRAVLETLRQPLETGQIIVSRANAHVRYPCQFMLVAAANPCKCGYLADPSRACPKSPQCGSDYFGRISGPLMDRFDLQVEAGQVSICDLGSANKGEESKHVAARVLDARQRQAMRYQDMPNIKTNADVVGDLLEKVTQTDTAGIEMMHRAAERFSLSARGYHRTLRVARTIADLAGQDDVLAHHIAEALSYRHAHHSQMLAA